MIKVKQWLDYFYECLFLFVVMEILYIITNNLVPVAPLLIIVLISGMVLTLLRRKKEIPLIYVLLLILASAGLGYMLGLNIYASGIWAALIGWRAFTHFIDTDVDPDNQHALFLLSLGACLLVHFTLSNSEDESILFLFPVIQFFYLIILKILGVLISQQESANSINRKYTVWGMGALVVSAIISILAIYFFPVIKTAVTTVVMWIGAALGYILINPAIWLFNLLIGDSDEKKFDNLMNKMEPPPEEKEKEPEQIDLLMAALADWLTFILVIAIITGMAIYLYKKKIRITARTITPETVSNASVNYSTEERGQRIKAPKHAVRKRFYQLQKSLARKGYARKAHESIEDWFNRLGNGYPEKSAIADYYQRVRYGGEDLTKEEIRQYEERIRRLVRETEKRKKET